MAKASTSWDVVATADEPAPLLAAFVAHHLGLGAGRVHLFLDAPDPEAEALLGSVPGVVLTVCGDAWWKAAGAAGRPATVTRRQQVNADHAYQRTGAGWLLHCDADEFLWPAADLEARLAAVPPEAGMVHLPVAERVWRAGEAAGAIFTPHFRLAQPGRGAALLDAGLSGHSAGKALVRVGRPYRMGIHAPRYDAGGAAPVPRAAATGDAILHFDGLTPLHWVLKLLRRAMGPDAGPEPDGSARRAQVGRVAALRGDGAGLRRLWQEVQALDARAEARLMAEDALVRIDTGIEEAVARLFPGVVDLSAEGFDRRLRARHAALIESAGLAFGIS